LPQATTAAKSLLSAMGSDCRREIIYGGEVAASNG